ncbi:hypothetical protein CNECB9_640004 [Cupriavidus necator]|uniref:Uncharacterized protein n=1 Tax=Cupriavidus necator TaxID=106590 RepID=A0A1K0J359_CUPNE|nr:hypothetical protein CNECB9_640004 [Cupriavidus necator]
MRSAASSRPVIRQTETTQPAARFAADKSVMLATNRGVAMSNATNGGFYVTTGLMTGWPAAGIASCAGYVTEGGWPNAGQGRIIYTFKHVC